MNKLLFFIIAFSAGFAVHALVFPDFLANGIVFIPNLTNSPNTPTPPNTQIEPLVTKISFDGQHFSRSNIAIQKTRYLAIVNTGSEKLMWLVSNEPLFTTSRGLGFQEQVKAQLSEAKQFVIADRQNPNERLVVTVK